MFRNCLITLAGKTICVEVEVIDALLDYKIILGHSYTYVMYAIPSVVHHNMCFPHNENIITIDS